MNWQQLKEFANSLTSEQLQQEVAGWDDNRTHWVISVEITEDCRYWDGMMYSPIGGFDDFERDCEDKTDILPIGTIRLNID